MAEIVCNNNTIGIHRGTCMVCDDTDAPCNNGICPTCSCDDKAMKQLMFYGRLDRARALRRAEAKRKKEVKP